MPIFDLFPPSFSDVNFGNGSLAAGSETRAKFNITTENLDAERYDLDYGGEIINVDNLNTVFDDYELRNSNFSSNLPYDTAVTVRLRSVHGSQVGAWSSSVTLYTSPEVPDSIDYGLLTHTETTDGVIIEYTPSNNQDGYILEYRLAGSTSSSFQYIGPLPQADLSPAQLTGLSSSTGYEYRVRPSNYSSHYPDTAFSNATKPAFVPFTTLQAGQGGSDSLINIIPEGFGTKKVSGSTTSLIGISPFGNGADAINLKGGHFTIANDALQWTNAAHNNAVFTLDHPSVPEGF